MGTINTRISIRSSNTFRNTVTFRHDRAYAVETRVDQGTRTITENTSGSPHLLADGSIYYDSSESGSIANQVYVFIRNTTLTANKTITIQFNKNGTRDDVITLGPGQRLHSSHGSVTQLQMISRCFQTTLMVLSSNT